jgi:hypothetical protein
MSAFRRGEGWKTIGAGHKPRKWSPENFPCSCHVNDKLIGKEQELVALLAQRTRHILSSNLYRDFKLFWQRTLRCRTDQVFDVVVYGIGRFGEFRNAQYQLVLVLLLMGKLEPEHKLIDVQNVYFFDPLLSEQESRVLDSFGMKRIEENEEGKRRVNRLTLFYMPHCGRALYNNVIWANWDSLENICILGNSFEGYLDRIRPTKRAHSDRDVETGICIAEAVQAGIVNEFQFVNDFGVIGAFNDLALHRFKNFANQTARPAEYIADGTCEAIIPKIKNLVI